MDELIQAMKRSLADSFAFYLKAHGFHWNVEGPDFLQYHDLFSKIYEEVFSSIDIYAEQIRALDAYSPASFSRFGELTAIQDEIKILPPRAMIEKLLTDINIVQQGIKLAYELAEANGKHGLSNFLAERQDAFAKHAWMLRSTLRQK